MVIIIYPDPWLNNVWWPLKVAAPPGNNARTESFVHAGFLLVLTCARKVSPVYRWIYAIFLRLFLFEKKLLLVSLQVHSTLLLLYFILFHFTWLSLVDLRLCPGHLRFWVTSRISNWFTAFKTSEMLLYFRLSWLNLFYSTPLLSCHRGFTPLLSACSACVWLREPTHVIGSSRHHKVNRFQSLSIWIKGNELEMPTWFWSADKKIFR